MGPLFLTVLTIAGCGFAAPAYLEKRGGSYYGLAFWDAGQQKMTGSDVDGYFWNHCVATPAGTAVISGEVQNMCIDVFVDDNCQTKYGTLQSDYGWCSTGDNLISLIDFSGDLPSNFLGFDGKLKKRQISAFGSYRGSIPS